MTNIHSLRFHIFKVFLSYVMFVSSFKGYWLFTLGSIVIKQNISLDELVSICYNCLGYHNFVCALAYSALICCLLASHILFLPPNFLGRLTVLFVKCNQHVFLVSIVSMHNIILLFCYIFTSRVDLYLIMQSVHQVVATQCIINMS